MIRALSIFAKDQLGLTGVWYEVPKTKELPPNHGIAASELQWNLQRDSNIRIEQNQRENRHAAKTGWPLKRRDQEAQGDTASAET